MSWAQITAVWERTVLLHRGVGCWRASRPASYLSREDIIEHSARYRKRNIRGPGADVCRAHCHPLQSALRAASSPEGEPRGLAIVQAITKPHASPV